MLEFVFDIISFLRFGYIVLCMIVGIGVVVGFSIKIVRFCKSFVNDLLMIRRIRKINANLEKKFGKKWTDEMKKRIQSKTNEAHDRSSDIYFAVGRAGQTGYSGQPIRNNKEDKN